MQQSQICCQKLRLSSTTHLEISEAHLRSVSQFLGLRIILTHPSSNAAFYQQESQEKRALNPQSCTAARSDCVTLHSLGSSHTAWFPISDFFPFLENEGGNGQKKFWVKSSEKLLFKSAPDEKNKICGNKIGWLGAELRAGKVRPNLARVARERIDLNFKQT